MTRRALVAALAALAPAAARAEPVFAVREGFTCGQCHANPSGGGMRNDFGALYGQTVLPLTRYATASGAGALLDPHVSDAISVGADVRTDFQVRVRPGKRAGRLGISEGNVYVYARLAGDRAAVYVDETLAPDPANREAAVFIRPPGGANAYVKAGNILAPYGLRLPDDGAFIRSVTGFNYGNSDLGVEFGLEPLPFSASVALTNGPERRAPARVSGVAQALLRAGDAVRLRAGVSGAYVDTADGFRVLGGLFAGVRVGRLALLAEADFIREKPGPEPETPNVDSLLAYGEADLLVLRGVNLKFAYEWMNPDLDIPAARAARTRMTVGVEFFPMQLVHASILVRDERDIPQRVEGNRRSAALQLHAYF